MPNSIQAAVNDRHFSLVKNSSPIFRTTDFHAHDEFEIFYFISGEVQYYLEENSYSMVPGDMLIIPPFVMHRPLMLNENVRFDRIVLNLSAEYCRQLMQGIPHSFLNGQVRPIRICMNKEESEDIQRHFQKLLSLENTPAGFLARDSICTLLLLQFQQLIDRAEPEDAAQMPQILEIIRYINAHFTEQLSLEDISGHFFISKSYLLKQFKKYTKTTVHSYITSKRIMLAKAMLKENIPVAQVSSACGFGSYPSFYQAFLADVGISPTQFVKKSAK